jgi:phage shock protein C
MSAVILQVADFVMANLLVVFSVVILVSYIIFLAGPHPKISTPPAMSRPVPSRPAYHHTSGGIKRLYRSGNEKILGGVCGGIAEYLGIDPVIVRLLWVIFVLAWGAGILAYLIAWIIIPRNPDHRWKN